MPTRPVVERREWRCDHSRGVSMLPTPTTLHAACHSRLSNVQEAAYCDPGLVSEVSIKNTHFKASIPSPNRHIGCFGTVAGGCSFAKARQPGLYFPCCYADVGPFRWNGQLVNASRPHACAVCNRPCSSASQPSSTRETMCAPLSHLALPRDTHVVLFFATVHEDDGASRWSVVH